MQLITSSLQLITSSLQLTSEVVRSLLARPQLLRTLMHQMRVLRKEMKRGHELLFEQGATPGAPSDPSGTEQGATGAPVRDAHGRPFHRATRR